MMQTLRSLTEDQVRAALGLSPEEFERAAHPSPDQLHDPFQYKEMFELVMNLRKLKEEQDRDPSAVLVIDGDYDTDGVCGAVILAASLAVFGFRYRVYIPSMADGYGMSPAAVLAMRSQFETDGSHIQAILTTDQGNNALAAIRYAKGQGIPVLVTDHHPAGRKRPDALAVVNPNQPGDRYPFKGNSGGTVAWKAMVAYAGRFNKEKLPLIQDLILFAGISNVSDVMPMLDENRYMVQAAMDRIQKIKKASSYSQVMDTACPAYNTVFHGLYDILRLLQASKDEKRIKAGKKPVDLPENEELIGWYLSPMLNAPRRVHDNCTEALAAFLVENPAQRQEMVKRLILCNEEKSRLRDLVLQNLTPEERQLPALFVNTRKGIAGLIAGQLSEVSGGLPSVVFSHNLPDSPKIRLDATDVSPTARLSGSARSSAACPLNLLFTHMLEQSPGLFTWGGHVGGAGCSVLARDFGRFTALMQEWIPRVVEETASQPGVVLLPPNEISLYLENPDKLTANYPRIEDGKPILCQSPVSLASFARDALDAHAFLESLRPFGESFQAQTTFLLTFTKKSAGESFDPNFWKTFKFKIQGVECLTFDTAWAEVVKAAPSLKLFTARAKLQINTFRGVTTPQLLLEPIDQP